MTPVLKTVVLVFAFVGLVVTVVAGFIAYIVRSDPKER